MAKTDFMTPIISNDLESANLKPMFEKIKGKRESSEYQGELEGLTNELTLTIGPDKSILDQLTATSLAQSKAVLQSMHEGGPCNLFLTQSISTWSTSRTPKKMLFTSMQWKD